MDDNLPGNNEEQQEVTSTSTDCSSLEKTSSINSVIITISTAISTREMSGGDSEISGGSSDISSGNEPSGEDEQNTHPSAIATLSGTPSTSRVMRGTHFSTRRVVMLPRVNTQAIVPIDSNRNTDHPTNNTTNGSGPIQPTVPATTSDNIYAGLTPQPPALLQTSVPVVRTFKSNHASKAAGVQLACGIVQLVCGFGIDEGVEGSHLPFYFQSMMPIWTGAIYLMTAVTGTVAVNSKRKLAIIVFMVFGFISLVISIALSAVIAPDVTGYDTIACYGNNSKNAPVDASIPLSEDSALECSEAELMTVLAAISLAFGLLDALGSFTIIVLTGQALFRFCSKPRINVFQEAPVFFRVGNEGDLEANIITGVTSPPVVVSLPRYDDIVGGGPPATSEGNENVIIAPRTPPPSYSQSPYSRRTSLSSEVQIIETL
ncbi:uncharacterized protein LOC143448893 [Clavelina lepadiformis]|uniref:uncharacterized protein LOC143448893 n=1 Tax=Clavelina lepadiformis TaxID=159417 RepID=UPI004043806E